MKNIKMETINRYNAMVGSNSTYIKDNFSDERSTIMKFLTVTRLHLETDLKDMAKIKGKRKDEFLNERERFLELLKITEELNVTIIQTDILDTTAKANIDILNRYNEAKNKQIKIMAIASVVLAVVAIAFSIAKMM